jgi:hypothetical protein
VRLITSQLIFAWADWGHRPFGSSVIKAAMLLVVFSFNDDVDQARVPTMASAHVTKQALEDVLWILS